MNLLNLTSVKVDSWLFCLPLTKETKPNTSPYSDYNIYSLAIRYATYCNLPLGNQHLSKVVLTSNTLSGNNISHKAITVSLSNKQWQQHQPHGNNICQQPQDGNNISHPGNNISQNKANINGTFLVQLLSMW